MSAAAARRHGGTPATVALDRAGITFAAHAYRHDPAVHSFGAEAAAALHADPGRVFKTLVVEVDDRLAVAVVPVSGRLDLKALARTLGGKHAELADASLAERKTGYVRGGISPIGQRQALPTVVDESAADYPTVFVSGGRRGFSIELAPDALLRASGGVTAAIAGP